MSKKSEAEQLMKNLCHDEHELGRLKNSTAKNTKVVEEMKKQTADDYHKLLGFIEQLIDTNEKCLVCGTQYHRKLMCINCFGGCS